MATAQHQDIKFDMRCGVGPQGKNIQLMYPIPNRKMGVTWEWTHHKNDDETSSYVAVMIVEEIKRGHQSKPVPHDIFKKLGSPKKSRTDKSFKVEMVAKDDLKAEDIEDFF